MTDIIAEKDSTPEDPLCHVVRGFYLTVAADGPQVAVPVGAIIRLTHGTARANFSLGRIAPVTPPDDGEYEVLTGFRTVQDRKWLDMNRGDIISMTWEEASHLLRQNQIRPKNFNLFGGTHNEIESAEELLCKK